MPHAHVTSVGHLVDARHVCESRSNTSIPLSTETRITRPTPGMNSTQRAGSTWCGVASSASTPSPPMIFTPVSTPTASNRCVGSYAMHVAECVPPCSETTLGRTSTAPRDLARSSTLGTAFRASVTALWSLVSLNMARIGDGDGHPRRCARAPFAPGSPAGSSIVVVIVSDSNEPRRKTEARRAPSFPKLGQMRKEPRAVPWRLCRCPTSPPSFTSAPPDLRRRLNHDYSGALLEQRVASSTPKVRTRSRRFDPPRRSRVGTA